MTEKQRVSIIMHLLDYVSYSQNGRSVPPKNKVIYLLLYILCFKLQFNIYSKYVSIQKWNVDWIYVWRQTSMEISHFASYLMPEGEGRGGVLSSINYLKFKFNSTLSLYILVNVVPNEYGFQADLV